MLSIHEAAKAQDREAILEFLQDEVSINEADHQYGYTPLHEAAQFHGDVPFLIWMEDHGADVCAKNFQGQEMLHVAAAAGRRGAVSHFLSKGLRLDSRSKIGWTPFHYAAKFCGDVDFLKFLVDSGADLDAKDPEGKLAIHLAAEGGQQMAVKWLKNKGQNINSRDHRGVTPLHCASKSCGSVPFLRFLKKQGAEKTAKSAEGQSMIHFSAARGHKDAVSYWKRKGQSVNARDFQGWTPLHVAAKANGHASFLIFLIEIGADASANTASGSSVLHVASQGGHRKAVSFLLSRGADVNAVDRNGFTPLHDAVEMKAEVDFLEYLVSKGADVHRVTGAKQTILHTAVRSGYAKGVEWGVGKGVDIFAKDDGGALDKKSALDYAVDFRKTDCLEVLLAEAERLRAAEAEAEPIPATKMLGRVASIRKTLSFRKNPNSPDLRRKYSQKISDVGSDKSGFGRTQSLRQKLSFRTFREKGQGQQRKNGAMPMGKDIKAETIVEMVEI